MEGWKRWMAGLAFLISTCPVCVTFLSSSEGDERRVWRCRIVEEEGW